MAQSGPRWFVQILLYWTVTWLLTRGAILHVTYVLFTLRQVISVGKFTYRDCGVRREGLLVILPLRHTALPPLPALKQVSKPASRRVFHCTVSGHTSCLWFYFGFGWEETKSQALG